MALGTFPCPECNAVLRYSANLQAGDEVQCPKCKAQFAVPIVDEPPNPPSRSREAVSDEPHSRRPRFSDAADEGISRTKHSAAYDEEEDDLEDEDDQNDLPPHEYSIDVNRWFAIAGNHYSSYFGPAIGFLFVANLIAAIPFWIIYLGGSLVAFSVAGDDLIQRFVVVQALIQLAMLALMPLLFFPLWHGMTAVCLLQLKGRRWTFGDFFAGFRHWLALAGIGLFAQILNVIVLVPFCILLFAAIRFQSVTLGVASGSALLIGWLVILFVAIRLLYFAPSIIFDRKVGAIEAMKANWQLTRGHFFGLFGVGLLLFLIFMAGELACGIGVLFALPYVMLILNAGYLLIGGRREPVEHPYSSDY